MISFLQQLILIFIGVAGGLAVGSGFVAFITVLDIVPRLAQLTREQVSVHVYEYAIIAGVISCTVLDGQSIVLGLPAIVIVPIGLCMGIFIGTLAAALTEVINVIPILVKRLNMQVHLLYLLMAMALGKTIGSLYQWLIFKVW